ncbi:MAG: fasciclin domain-containing protein [Bacteroidales bacterium]|nr:fasciclin domain-containing protein [Bacteroidales bacterium]
MKKQFLKIKARQVTYLMFLLSALAIFSISCEKEDSVAPVATENPELSIVEVLQSFGETETEEGANLKRGRGAPAPGDASIAEIAIDAEFNELVGALAYVDEELDAGLVDLFLNGTDQYTVFAPTDEAFEALYEALGIDEISDLPAELVLDVLFYHVTEGRRASNSVLPPRGYRTITTLLEETFKVDPDGRIEAIGNEANITAADVSASNGIIHVIDAVILPIHGEESSKAALKKGHEGNGKSLPPGDNSIAAIAIEAGFSELVGALRYVDDSLDAGLVDLFLNGTDQYTVFAPTDEAFMKLYDALGDDVDEIRDLPAELVLDVLLYHVTEGRRASNSVVPPVRPREITTLLEEKFWVDSKGMITAIGSEAKIQTPDISASNGIIHVIDAVLLPIK